MTNLSDNQVQNAILEILHESFRENPRIFGIDRKTMQEKLALIEAGFDLVSADPNDTQYFRKRK